MISLQASVSSIRLLYLFFLSQSHFFETFFEYKKHHVIYIKEHNQNT